MHHILLFIYLLFFTNTSSSLDSKLDFGDDKGGSIVKVSQHSAPKYKFSNVVENNEDVQIKEGIFCSDGGCNKTITEESNDVVKTDVIVQVKTSVNPVNKTKNKEDVPDIPVILGTKGVGSANIHRGLHKGLQYRPPSLSSVRNPPSVVVTNIEDVFPSLKSPLMPSSLYVPSTSGIEMKIDTLPPVMVSIPDGYQYKTDGLEIKVPYFEPSYHSHYYGENSPPQFAFYPKRRNGHNPVAFNSVARPSYSLPAWNQNIPTLNQNHPSHDCKCENRKNVGLHWHSTSGNRKNVHQNINPGVIVDPGTQIDDKLDDLN